MGPVDRQIEHVARFQDHVDTVQSSSTREAIVVELGELDPAAAVVLRNGLEVEVADLARVIEMEGLVPIS